MFAVKDGKLIRKLASISSGFVLDSTGDIYTTAPSVTKVAIIIEVTARADSITTGAVTGTIIVTNFVALTAKAELLSSCSAAAPLKIFANINNLLIINGDIFKYHKKLNSIVTTYNGLLFRLAPSETAPLGASAKCEIVLSSTANISDLAYNKPPIGVTASTDIIFTLNNGNQLWDGVVLSEITSLKFLGGNLYLHAFGHKKPVSCDGGFPYKNIVLEFKNILSATANASLQTNSSKATLSNYEYRYWLPTTANALSRLGATTLSTIFDGVSGIALQVDSDGYLFDHLYGPKPAHNFYQGFHYRVLVSQEHQIHPASVSASFVSDSTSTKAYLDSENIIITCTASTSLIFEENNISTLHNSLYNSLPVPYYTNGKLFKYKTGTPSPHRKFYCDQGNLYNITWWSKSYIFNILEATTKADLILTLNNTANTTHHELNPSTSRVDLVLNCSAIADLHEVLESFASADFISYATSNAVAAPATIVSCSGNLISDSYIKAHTKFGIVASGSSTLDASAASVEASPTTARGGSVTDGLAELCINWQMKAKARADFVSNGTGHENYIFKATPSKVDLKAELKTNSFLIQITTTRTDINFIADGDVFYKYVQIARADIVFNTSNNIYRVRAVIVSAKANSIFGANGTVSSFHWHDSTTRADLKFIPSARCSNKIKAKSTANGLKFSVTKTKVNIWGNAYSTVDFVSGGSAWTPPFNVKKVTARGGFVFNSQASCERKYYLYQQGLRNTLRWNQVANVDHYDIYRSDWPGTVYYKIGKTLQSSSPSYEVPIKIIPRNFSATSQVIGSRLTWQEPEFTGSPMTFKIVPVTPEGIEMLTPVNDLAWMNDDLPTGASWTDQTGMTTSTYRRHGSTSIKVTAMNGYAEPKFMGAINCISDSNIIVWVNIKGNEIPDSIWLSLYDGSNFEHRIYWGENSCPFGENGGESRIYAEALPNPGTWAPLIFHTKEVNISTVSGIGFGVYKQNGTGTVYFDSIYYTPQPVKKLPFPHTCLRSENTYAIYRDDRFIAFSNDTSYYDHEAIDKYGYTTKGGGPVYRIELIDLEDKIKISWGIPDSRGTSYNYKLSCFDNNGVESDFLEASVHITTTYSKVAITISSPSTSEYTVECTGFNYILENVHHGETYKFVLTSYDGVGGIVATNTIYYTIPWGSVLDEFILDESILA